MPWHTQGDTARHNKAAAKSPKKGKLWRKVANQTLERTGDDATAIREANAVVKRARYA